MEIKEGQEVDIRIQPDGTYINGLRIMPRNLTVEAGPREVEWSKGVVILGTSVPFDYLIEEYYKSSKRLFEGEWHMLSRIYPLRERG